jgi:hypothetical protein
MVSTKSLSAGEVVCSIRAFHFGFQIFFSSYKMLLQQLRRDQLCSSTSVVQVVAAVLCLVAAGAISYVEAAVQYYDWTVAYSYASPDCVEKLVMAVNGQVPGPRIDATQGDTVVVNLTNLLPTEGVVIHWHGMHQVRKVVLLPAGSWKAPPPPPPQAELACIIQDYTESAASQVCRIC